MSKRIHSLTMWGLGAPLLAIALPTAISYADTIYVCWDGSGDYVTIQEGIDAAVDGDEVVICDGTYIGPGNRNLDFAGKAITVRSASGDPQLCIIDCEGEGRGFYFHSGETAESVLEGLAIRHGNAREGGGVLCENGSSPTLSKCKVAQNTADWSGGGIACFDASDPTVTWCTISGNWADWDGGGIYCENSSPTITDCVITKNVAGYGGGGINCYMDGAPTIIRCTIAANEAGSGGGIQLLMYGHPGSASIADCVIAGNLAFFDGGGVYCAGRVTISDCTLAGNVVASPWGDLGRGGGLYCIGDPTITNCDIKWNSAPGDEQSGSFGGGIYCQGGATFNECRIMRNSADFGGGMFIERSSAPPQLAACTFEENSATFDGGGLFNWDGARPTLVDCVFDRNSAFGTGYSDGGGAVFSERARPTFVDCLFTRNLATGRELNDGGGAVYNYRCIGVTLVGCSFVNNYTSGQGGALHSGYLSAQALIGCTFSGNRAAGDGGAMHITGTVAPDQGVTSCVFSGNSASGDGGAICTREAFAPLHLNNCTLSGNVADHRGAGIFSAEGAPPTAANTILWANSDSGGSDESAQVHVEDGAPVVNYCCVQGWSGDLGGVGNISDDPLFVDPDSEDYHLAPGSPCIDAGCNGAVPPDSQDLDDDGDTSEALPIDLDGEGRFFDDPGTPDTGCGYSAIVDLGAYEFGGTGPQPCPGDLDGDRDVDEADLGILLSRWGLTDECDLDCDGDIDQSDLGILLANWGVVCP